MMTSARSEARAAFDAYVASEPERLDAFRRAVAAGGGPSEDQLDLSRESLGPLGAWALVVRFAATEDEGLREGLATYFAGALRARHPQLEWRLDEDRRSTNHGRPVVIGFGQAELYPRLPVGGRLKLLRASPQPDPDWLVKLFDTWSGFVPAHATRAGSDETELRDVDVGSITGDPDWNAEIWITEAVESMLGSAAFTRLESSFAGLDGIERIAWEDREHFLIRVRRGADLGQIRDSVRAVLAAAREAAGAGQADP